MVDAGAPGVCWTEFTVTMYFVVCERPWLVLVTVTVYVPGEPEQESVDDPVVRVAGLRLHVRPLVSTVSVRATVPEKPSWGLIVIVAVPVVPAFVVIVLEDWPTVKSWTVTLTDGALFEIAPLVPVMVTV